MTNAFQPDPVVAARSLFKEKKGFPWFLAMACAALFAFSFFMYTWQYQFTGADLYIHSQLASEFNFLDPHSITSRLAYPMWHLCVSVLYQAGLPLAWSAAIMCSLAKVLGLVLAWWLLRVLAGRRVPLPVLTIAAFCLMFITSLRLPWFNPVVYRGVGSPTVWHNPTQTMVAFSMLLCVPYLAHCWYEFERRLPLYRQKAKLPWHMPAILAALNMFCLSCKPTFMQAFIPAAFLFFLIQWIRHPRNSAFFFQIILAFLPAVGYFGLQYLYYTGVLVEFTSGLEFGLTPGSAWNAIRSALLMSAFPLFAMLCCRRKDLLQDKMLVLALIMLLISALQSMFFRETGLRQGHGNFNWAAMSCSLLLWILMTGHFLRSVAAFKEAKDKSWYRVAAFGAGFSLLLWHLYSSWYYVYYLFKWGTMF